MTTLMFSLAIIFIPNFALPACNSHLFALTGTIEKALFDMCKK